MRILHTGDWHIGNFNGPEVKGENARFLDLCKCLDALTAQAIEGKPDFIIVAGDLFHQARVWSDRGLRESQTVIHYVRLLEKVAPVIIVRGTPNHDSEQQFNSLKTAFEGDDGVHIFTEPGVHVIHGYHSGEAVNIAALPGFDRGYFRAKNPGLDKEEENAVFTQALEDIIIGMKAQCDSSFPSVLVGHYTITGANTESGQTALFAQYEPVVEPATLAAAGYDLVCFGHIHRPQMLDGCNNTFYCGAISALNFNDEGQERGFYIHDLPTRGRKFYQLPTRQFLTVRLVDEDIEAINAGDDMKWLSDAEGKIVRVLYDCTDEHNKALNKTMMEQRLYELGAFWVQEITPQKISITVDKSSLSDDDSPEANLKAYLAEKELPEAVAGRIVERARPIIAEAVEAHMTEHTSGTFVPVEIEVHNYRNYRDETFNFEGIQFCTINGENGAGKSSLFMDAMCDALFEETREGDIAGWISNSEEARSGSIKFTFRLGEALYRVTRTRMKSGKATLNLAEEVEGEWVDRSKEKMRDTQAEILNVIGMDSLTLKATALIMQDQYGLFLTADKEARMTILGNILGLGAYDDMETGAASRLTDVNREIRSTQEKAADITASVPDEDELRQRIEEKQAAIKQQTEDIAAKRAEADNMKLTLSTMEAAAERVAKLNARIASTGAKKTAVTAQITAQKGIVWSAEQILAERPDIEAAVNEHAGLLNRERALITVKTTRDELLRQMTAKERERDGALAAADELKKKQGAMRLAKLLPAQQTITAEAELTEAHAQYGAAKEHYEAIRTRGEAWRQAQQRVTEAETALTVCRARGDADVRDAKANLDNLTRRAKLLDDNACPYAEEVRCTFMADALDAKEHIPAAEATYQQAQEAAKKSAEAAEEALREARLAVPTDYSPAAEKAAQDVLAGLEDSERRYGELAVAKAELAAAEERIGDLAKQEEEKRQQAAALAGEVAELNERCDGLAEQMKEYEQVKARMETLAPYLEKEKQLPVAEEKKATAEARIEELDDECAALDLEIVEMDKEREEELKKTVGSAELMAQYQQKTQEIDAGEQAIRDANMALGALQKTLERAQEQRAQVAELMEKVENLSVEASDLDTLKQAFSQDGIPHNIVRSIIPIFEATATNILGQMSGGHMSVEFVMEKTLKSNSKKEVTVLDIVINDSTTGRLPYMSRSGGERVKAALAVILALAEIKSTKAGVQLGFLFIDEPPFLDAQGVTAYCDALEAIQRRYASLKLMAITHDPAMKSRFPQSVDVVKTAEGSKVIYE